MTYQMQKTKSLSLHSPIKSSHIINFHTTKYSRPHTNPPLKIHIHNIIIKKKKKKKVMSFAEYVIKTISNRRLNYTTFRFSMKEIPNLQKKTDETVKN